MGFNKLKGACKAYFIGVILIAAAMATLPIIKPVDQWLTVQFLVLLVCAAAVAPINIKIPYVDSHFSMDTGFFSLCFSPWI